MTNEEINFIANDYKLDKNIILKILALLEKNKKVKKKDISNLLELTCFEYMHLDCQSDITRLTDEQINKMLSDKEVTKEIINDKYESLNDLTIDLSTLIDEIVTLFYREDSDYKDIYTA